MKNFRNLSEELTPSSKPEPGRQAVGGRFTSSSPKRPMKPAPHVTSEENISEIIMPQVKDDLGVLDKMSFVKKHGISKTAAKQRLATEAKEKTEYDYEGDMARGQLQSIISNAQRVHDMLKDDTNIAEWVQSKITLAEDYISTVANYMMSELDEAKEVGDIPSGDENSPNVSLKKGKTVITNTVTEASSAAVRMAKALQRAKEQREREERAGAALLKPKPKTEEVMVEREDDEYHTPSKHHVQVQVSKGDGPKTHRKATVRAKEPKHAVSAAIAHYKQQGYTVHDHKYLGEDVEQIEEGAKETAQKAINLADKLRKKDPEKSKIYRNLGIKASQRSNNPTGVKSGQPHGSGNKALRKQGIEPVPSSISSSKMRGYFEEVESIDEGRASQRHPLEGHEYHKKSDEALIHIAKDAHAAAEAMKSHNTTAENKYRDQANDSATVRHFRKTSGMPDWYKKKYGHVKEEVVNEVMDEPNYKNSIQARQKKADDANKPPFDGPYTTRPSTVTDKSGAKHTPMSRARDLARNAAKRQAQKMPVKKDLEESRKAEIVKEIMKKGKKKEDNSFQAEPVIGSTVVKADN